MQAIFLRARLQNKMSQEAPWCGDCKGGDDGRQERGRGCLAEVRIASARGNKPLVIKAKRGRRVRIATEGEGRVANLYYERKLRKRMEEKKRTEEQKGVTNSEGASSARRILAARGPTRIKQFSVIITKFPNQILHGITIRLSRIKFSLITL